jgi:hypothetical protein
MCARHAIRYASIGVNRTESPEIDNKGAVDLANNWSIRGRIRHIKVRQYFLRDLKMEGTILTKWLSGTEMSSNLFTKNLARPIFEQQTKTFCGTDQYMRDKNYETLKGRVLESVIESKGEYVPSTEVTRNPL